MIVKVSGYNGFVSADYKAKIYIEEYSNGGGQDRIDKLYEVGHLASIGGVAKVDKKKKRTLFSKLKHREIRWSFDST